MEEEGVMAQLNKIFGMEKKQKYGMISNIWFNMKETKKWNKKLFSYQWLCILPNVAAAFIGTLLPAELVRGLENGWDIEDIMVYIFLLTVIMWFCHMVDSGMRCYLRFEGATLSLYYSKKCFHKVMDLDYDKLEQEQKLIGNTWKAIKEDSNFAGILQAFPAILQGTLGILGYGALIARNSIWILGLVLCSVLLRFYLLSLAKRKHRKYHVDLSQYAKEAAYLSRQTMESAAGKDIRIYQMAEWFLEKYRDVLEQMDQIFKKIHNWYFFSGFGNSAINFMLNIWIYGYLIWQVSNGTITAASFVLSIGLVQGFSTYFSLFFRQVISINPFCAAIGYIREFLEISNQWKQTQGVGKEQIENIKKTGVKLELRQVSFTYPGNQKPTLQEINLVIHPGEKLALLGLNGAGKTTLVKLICGFYHPTEGEILLNDIPIREFSREEYYQLVSVLFQDSTMLPLSLDENLTGKADTQIDRERLSMALQLSGFEERYQQIVKKGKALLVREVNEAAEDFSGGEKQKLIFARALYKEASLLILDEPTAALDPIAENELYLNYGKATKGRTSIYISHRLSSTRFCDRIILLENGKIIEEGTHTSLLSAKTRYAQLFMVQSQYYKEQEEKKRKQKLMGDKVEENLEWLEEGQREGEAFL